MSGVDVLARGLAIRAANRITATGPTLFADIAGHTPDSETVQLATAGYATNGAGAARYIHDALCDEALLSDHPRCVIRAGDARIFRLLPEAGAISVEQAGAAGEAGVDDQSAIQSAIDYAQAIGAGSVLFGQGHYELWAPTRTTHYKDQFARDGHFIRIERSITLRGVAATRTTLDCRAQGGGDPEASWQIVPFDTNDASDAIWRGNACTVLGNLGIESGDPLRVDRVELHRLIFVGNTSPTGEHTWPADPVTGDGWDGSHQGFKVQDTIVGDIVLEDTDFIGWRGELLYLAGHDARSLTLSRVKLLGTNGNAMNPGVNVPIIANDCEFGEAFQAHEDTGKRFARYTGCIWRDSDRLNIGSGPTNGLIYNYLYPTRDEAGQPPITQFDGCEFRNIGTAYIGGWTRGALRTTDTIVSLSGTQYMKLQDIDLRIDAWIDQKDAISPIQLFGPTTLTQQINGAPTGDYVQPPEAIHIALRHYRTRLAAEANRAWAPVRWSGYIEKNCSIVIDGSQATTAPSGQDNPMRSMPLIALRNMSKTIGYIPHGAVNIGPINASGPLAITGPVLLAHSGVEGVFDLTLPNTTSGGGAYGFADGQLVRLYKNGDVADLRFVQGAVASFAVPETRVLAKGGDWIEFAFNSSANRWEEAGYFTSFARRLDAELESHDFGSIAAGDTASVTIAVPGAQPGEGAQVAFSAHLSDAIAQAQVTGSGSVDVTVFNAGASALAPGPIDIAVAVRR